VLPPWRAIYVTDAERDQTFDEAEAVHGRILDCYRNAGYSTEIVPAAPPGERARFVLRALGLD